MIIKDGTNAKIESLKERLGLTGDVYLVGQNYIENLESHKRLLPDSIATTIEEAEAERLEYMRAEQERIEQLAAEEEERRKTELEKESSSEIEEDENSQVEETDYYKESIGEYEPDVSES